MFLTEAPDSRNSPTPTLLFWLGPEKRFTGERSPVSDGSDVFLEASFTEAVVVDFS